MTPPGRQRSSASISDITRLITKIGSSSENGFIIDSFFDVYYVSNIGSSGLDGVSFDSFFDIVYSFDERTKHTIPVEMVALSLSVIPNDPTNPGGPLDAVRKGLIGAGGDVVIGHVTILK